MNGTATDLPVGQSGDLFSDSHRSAFAREGSALPATRSYDLVRLPLISHDFIRSKVVVVHFFTREQALLRIGLSAVTQKSAGGRPARVRYASIAAKFRSAAK